MLGIAMRSTLICWVVQGMKNLTKMVYFICLGRFFAYSNSKSTVKTPNSYWRVSYLSVLHYIIVHNNFLHILATKKSVWKIWKLLGPEFWGKSSGPDSGVLTMKQEMTGVLFVLYFDLFSYSEVKTRAPRSAHTRNGGP